MAHSSSVVGRALHHELGIRLVAANGRIHDRLWPIWMGNVMIYVIVYLLFVAILGFIVYDVRKRCEFLGEMREQYKCDCENCECKRDDHT